MCDPRASWEGPAEILVRKGRVEAVSPSIGPVDVPIIELHGKTVLPGLVDMHVHLREPGGEAAETIASGCAAAAAGGFTAVACMPNTSPALDDREAVACVRQRADSAGLARVYPIGALTRGLGGKEMSAMWNLAQEGVKGFSDDGMPVIDGGLMLRAMQFALLLGLPVISHCEDLSISSGGVVHAGTCGYRQGLPVIPSVSEAVMVARELLLQKHTGARLHLAHVSTRESVALLRWAAGEGINVTAEVTPHHLFLTEEAVEGFNTDAKMNPPLRSPSDREALLEALRGGLITVVATDHAPHSLPDKEKDFLSAPFGVVGLETALPLLWTMLVERGLLSRAELVNCLSANPAAVLGVPGGTLAPGAPADLVVVDSGKEFTVDRENFYSRGKNTPFQGWRLRGLPVLTMVGGDIKMWKGRVKGFSSHFPETDALITGRELF